MDNKLLLVKSITLLYRESLLPVKTDNSSDLIRTVIEDVKITDVNIGINTGRETLAGLKDTVLEMCNNPLDFVYEKDLLLQQLQINTINDEKLFEIIQKGISEELSESLNKRTITNIIKSINNHFRESKVSDILSKASFAYKMNRDKIKDSSVFISELIAQLEPLQANVNLKDPALIDDIDLGDEGSVSTVFKEIQDNSTSKTVLKFGWQALNKMLQGGIRRGEFMTVGALQHQYKTGVTLSMFIQIAKYNIPIMIDATKKPLLLRISFEDSLTNNLQFLYQNLKENELGVRVKVNDVPVEEMSSYVKTKMQINGYHIKMMRVDPTKWSYREICNKVIEFESQGYECHLLMIDYLALVPTTGCITSGAGGTDIRDMFRRIRNFCGPKKIACITPHQLSTEAKQLIRDGRKDFVKDLDGKGYYAGSKQLDQEIDIELYVHIEKHNKESYLTFQRGKHRLPTVIPDEDKYFALKFRKGGIIDDDLEKDDSSLTSFTEDSTDDLFSFSPKQ